VSSSPSQAPDLTVRPGVVSRAISGFGTSIGVGAALGGAAWISDQLSWPFSLLIPANAIGAWLGIAFLLGASARTIPTGVLRGLIGLLSAVGAYYLLNAALGQGFRVIGASHAATVWGAVALLAGPLMGGAGSVWRYGQGWPRAIGVGILAAALIGEGLVFGAGRLVRVDQLGTDPGAILLAVEILLGAALPWLLLGRGERMRGYVATAVLTIVAAAAIGPVTNLIRALADRF
jgi:hypothetical protein